MIKAFRKNAFKKLLAYLIILLGSALGLMCMTNFGIFKLIGGTSDIEKVAPADLNGSYVKVKLKDVLGTFVNLSYTGSSESKKLVSSYCILNYSENQYIILCLDGKYSSTLEKYETMIKSASSPDVLAKINTTFSGGITSIDNDDLRQYYVDSLYDLGVISSNDEYACGDNIHMLTVTADSISGVGIAKIKLLTVISAALIALIVILIALAFSGVFFADAKKLTSGTDSSEDYINGKLFKNLCVGKNFIYYTKGLHGFAIKSSSVVWIYPSSKRLEGDKMKWSLVLNDDNKQQYRVYLKDAEEVQDAISAIKALGNPLVIGFDAEKKALFEKNYGKFYSIAVNESKSALQ